jgi:hypothetical protein
MPTPTPTQMYEPPLLRFLREIGGDGKESFAKAVGTTVPYLHQMIGQAAPNPGLILSLAIEAESHRLHRQTGVTPLTLPDLLVGRIKAQQVKDHTTGEPFTLLPNGEMARRRIDGQGRVVLVDDRGRVVAVEDSFPGASTLKRIPLLDDNA